MLISIIVALILLWILFKIAKKTIKLLAFAILIGMGFYWFSGGTNIGLTDKFFKDASTLNELPLICKEDVEGLKEIKCDCIVQPVYKDLKIRLDKDRLKEVEADPELFKAELRKSLRNRRKEIKECVLKDKGPEIANKIGDAIDNIGDTMHDIRDFTKEVEEFIEKVQALGE